MKKIAFENASLELVLFSADVITTSGELNPGGDSIDTVPGDENIQTLSDNPYPFAG